MFHKLIKDIIKYTILSLKKKEIIIQNELILFSKFSVQISKNINHGNYSSNVAMILFSIEQKQSPLFFAKIIKKNIIKNDIINSIKIIKPGFLNFELKNHAIYKLINSKLKNKNKINYFKYKKFNKKNILIEFTSANPTGPIHLGHAKSAFFGDILSRILKYIKYSTINEFYINDFGKQIKKLAFSIFLQYNKIHNNYINISYNGYPGKYINNIAIKIKKKDKNIWINSYEKTWFPYFCKYGIKYNLTSIKKTLKKSNIEINSWYSEKILYKKKKITKLLKTYKKLNILYKSVNFNKSNKKNLNNKYFNNKTYKINNTLLKTNEFKNNLSKIILRHDNTPVYLTADLAYHSNKISRNFYKIINIVGADHDGHIFKIKSGIKTLSKSESKIHFILIQMVKLFKDNHEIKLSKRTGGMYKLNQLTKKIGKDATRFIFIMNSNNNKLNFNIDKLMHKNNNNPVFYIQYAYARICNLIKKAKNIKIYINKIKYKKKYLKLLNIPIEKEIIKIILNYDNIIHSCIKDLEVYHITNYSYNLSSIFHKYFTSNKNKNPIFSEDKKQTTARLFLILSLQITLKNALNLIKISAPGTMNAKNKQY
jgi:arginyl-tRNA synthetase